MSKQKATDKGQCFLLGLPFSSFHYFLTKQGTVQARTEWPGASHVLVKADGPQPCWQIPKLHKLHISQPCVARSGCWVQPMWPYRPSSLQSPTPNLTAYHFLSREIPRLPSSFTPSFCSLSLDITAPRSLGRRASLGLLS